MHLSRHFLKLVNTYRIKPLVQYMCNVSVFSVPGAEGLEKVLTTATLAPVPWGWEVEGQSVHSGTGSLWPRVCCTNWVLANVFIVVEGFYGVIEFFLSLLAFLYLAACILLVQIHFLIILLYVRILWLLPPIEHVPPPQFIDSKTISWTSPCSGPKDKFHPFLLVFSGLLLGLVWPMLPVCIIL